MKIADLFNFSSSDGLLSLTDHNANDVMSTLTTRALKLAKKGICLILEFAFLFLIT